MFPSTPKQKFSLSKRSKILPQIIATHTKKKKIIYPLLPKAYIVQNEIKKKKVVVEVHKNCTKSDKRSILCTKSAFLHKK